jgi:Ca2+-binding EF-hand superfamily protein
MRTRRLLIHVVLTLAALWLPSFATAQPAPTALDPRFAVQDQVMPGARLEGYLERMRGLHRKTDLNSDGVVSIADFGQYWVGAAVSGRVDAIAGLLRYDLDGDGVVTRADVVQVETPRVRLEARKDPKVTQDELSILQRIDRAADLRMRADLNRDGRIDWPEMQAFAKQAPILNNFLYEHAYRSIMSFDEDGDGAVTIEEFDRTAEHIFRAIDVDKDGTLSKDEIDAFLREVKQVAVSNDATVQARVMAQEEKRMHERQETTKRACAMPQPSATATVLLLDAHGGDALSTVTIGSQWIATETGSIDIEPGIGPLYIVVASYTPVIWQLSGAVGRVERLVLAGESTGPNQSLAGQTPLIGATGVPSERVVFLGQPGCMTYHAGPTVMQSQAAAEAVRRETGRDAVVIKPRKQDATKVAALSDEMRRFHPGGIVEIDPRTVVASQPVERYDVMPQDAGLIQLEHDGAITGSRLGGFLVHKKIRFPAGLYGAHLVRFSIQKGTHMPEGDPGHSCVIAEETGMMLYNGATCHGQFGLKR